MRANTQPWQHGTAPTAPRADSGAGVVVEQGRQSRRAGLGRASCVQLCGQQEADALYGGAGGCLRCGGLFWVDGGTGSSSEKVSLEPALCRLPQDSLAPVCVSGPAAWQQPGNSPREHFFPRPGTATSGGFVSLPFPGWTPAFSLGDVPPGEMSTGENRSIPAPALQRSPRCPWASPGHHGTHSPSPQPGEQTGQRWGSLSLVTGLFSVR